MIFKATKEFDYSGAIYEYYRSVDHDGAIKSQPSCPQLAQGRGLEHVRGGAVELQQNRSPTSTIPSLPADRRSIKYRI